MGHAMVEYAPGEILDFYSNCDGERVEGHSGYGWMEYRRSVDYGMTFSEPRVLDYSMRLYREGIHTALCEKAVLAPDGRIILFFQITDASKPISCEPWSEPTLITSVDGGNTWSEGCTFGADKGRIYDAIPYQNSIFVISMSNDASQTFLGNKPEHVYKLYRSDDSGKTFYTASILPIDTIGKGYGALAFSKSGELYGYVYDANDEEHLEYVVSCDLGKSWNTPCRSYVGKKIRNPQVAQLGDIWFLHGRNGGTGNGLVLYSSSDGINWDNGMLLAQRPAGGGTAYYSNNLPISSFSSSGPDRMLIQYSHVYEKNRVNIMHTWVFLNK